jgi:hypothetical protein
MTDHSPLERRYRRWLALYPKSFRAEREDEMAAVLVQGADPDQSHPRAREAVNLAAHGVRQRAREERLPGKWERAHANVMFPVRIISALWLCLLSLFLIAYHRGELWLLLIVPAIVLHLYIAYRIRPAAIPR